MGKRFTLVTGGARSGKSAFALGLAQQKSGGTALFVATAEARDEEMQARIAAHRAARPSAWATIETPDHVARALRAAPPARVVLLDCVTLWTSNVLLTHGPSAAQEMNRQLDELFEWYRAADVELIVVSNEVGMGLVPSNELGRTFRDLLGSVNCRLAAAADDVYLLIAGLAIEVKALALRQHG
jgi:adenosylcobinamide kinase/adenosylcobinamide-phosphate guanylyltransferase